MERVQFGHIAVPVVTNGIGESAVNGRRNAMFIQTEATPNPATLKFIPGKPVLADGTADFRGKGEATARRSRAVCSRSTASTGVFLGSDFISVTKGGGRVAAPEADDPRRHHGALHVGCRRRRRRARPTTRAGGSFDPKDAEVVATIKELLETRVRPAVAQDGGDITFAGFRDGVVYLHMRGACSGCPSSTATLRHGIENLLAPLLSRGRGSAGRLTKRP